jgi:hypothetical protein
MLQIALNTACVKQLKTKVKCFVVARQRTLKMTFQGKEAKQISWEFKMVELHSEKARGPDNLPKVQTQRLIQMARIK